MRARPDHLGRRARAGDERAQRGVGAPSPLRAGAPPRFLRPGRPAAAGPAAGDARTGDALGGLQRTGLAPAGRGRLRVGRRRRRLHPVPLPPDRGRDRPGADAGRLPPGRPRRAGPLPLGVPWHVQQRRRLLFLHGRRAHPGGAHVPGGGAAPDRARPRRRGLRGTGPPRWRRARSRGPTLRRQRRAGRRAQGLQDAGVVLRDLQGAPSRAARTGAGRPGRGRAAAAPRHRGDRRGGRG